MNRDSQIWLIIATGLAVVSMAQEQCQNMWEANLNDPSAKICAGTSVRLFFLIFKVHLLRSNLISNNIQLRLAETLHASFHSPTTEFLTSTVSSTRPCQITSRPVRIRRVAGSGVWFPRMPLFMEWPLVRRVDTGRVARVWREALWFGSLAFDSPRRPSRRVPLNRRIMLCILRMSSPPLLVRFIRMVRRLARSLAIHRKFRWMFLDSREGTQRL